MTDETESRSGYTVLGIATTLLNRIFPSAPRGLTESPSLIVALLLDSGQDFNV